MTYYFTWFICSWAFGAFGAWAARSYALRKDWLDYPNERSSHDKPTPRIGGIGILLPLLIAIPAIFLPGEFSLQKNWLLLLMPALLIALLSSFDDRFNLSRLVRFGGHSFCAILLLWLFFPAWIGGPLPLVGSLLPSFVAAVLLLIWITGLTNAYNFMDGIDGISAVQAVVAIGGWISVVVLDPAINNFARDSQILVLLVLAGGLLGFLLLNWAPAGIFMGDMGSTFLGFYLASLPFGAAQMGLPLDRALEASVLFLWPFITDAAVTFLVRLVKCENVFEAHRSHLYQVLAATFTSRDRGHRVTSLLFAAMALLGVVLYWTSGPFWAKLAVLAGVWVALTAWTYGIRVPEGKVRSSSTEANSSSDDSKELNFSASFMPFEIYLSPPEISESEQRFVMKALSSGFIAPVGPQLTAFEGELATYFGMEEVQAVSSGTAAIHLCLRALGVGPGDYVLAPDLTFIASVNPIRYLGAEPVLVDVDRDNWAMDPDIAREAIETLKAEGRQVKAMVVVHAFGIPAPMEKFMVIAREHGVAVLEDCAGAFGSRIGDQHVGQFGDAAAFSFNGNKVLTTSGGGALYLRDSEKRPVVRSWANQGRDPSVVGYAHDTLGYNYKLSNICAAIGLGQLETVSDRLARKRAHFRRYQEQLADLPNVSFMQEPAYGTNNYWLSSLSVGSQTHAEEIVRILRAEGIEAAPMWKPMHLQVLNKDLRFFGGSVSERIYRSHISLPSGSALTIEQIDRVCATVRKAIELANASSSSQG